jgi:SAM-dependent methyltransferase
LSGAIQRERDPVTGWLSAGADPSKPSIARVYDFWLGGDHNLVVDRELGEAMARLDPWIPSACKANRAFLGRAVQYLAGAGIRQFLDLGSGIPTGGNVHQIAQSLAPDARVIYVDRDPAAVADSRTLLADTENAAIIEADIRKPAEILSDPEVRSLIDFARPVAVMLVGVLHFVPDGDQPHEIVRELGEACAPGSYLVISHVTSHGKPHVTAAAERLYHYHAADSQARTWDEIAAFFHGWILEGPGLVWASQWRPAQPGDTPADPERLWFLAGVARKPRAGEC